jgi:hypothetical protein
MLLPEVFVPFNIAFEIHEELYSEIKDKIRNEQEYLRQTYKTIFLPNTIIYIGRRARSVTDSFLSLHFFGYLSDHLKFTRYNQRKVYTYYMNPIKHISY